MQAYISDQPTLAPPTQDFVFVCGVTKIDYAEWRLIQILFPNYTVYVLPNFSISASRISNIF